MGRLVSLKGGRESTSTARLCFVVVVSLVAASCGADTVDAGAGAEQRPAQCQDAAEIVDVVTAGLPAFDYDPAPDIESLVAQTDVVITGTLDSVVRIESDALVSSTGFESFTEFRIGESIPYGEVPEAFADSLEAERRFFIGSQWSGGEDPLGDPVLFDSGRTRFVAFLTATGNDSVPWTFGPQGLHIWCSFDHELQSVIDSIPVNTAIAPDYFDQAIIDIVDPAPVFDFIDVPSRLLADDIAAGDPWTARVIEQLSDVNPAVGDFEIDADNIDADNEVIFEFVVPESGSCPLGPFETLQFDQNSRVLVPVFAEVDRDGDCTADANPHLLLVAVARQDLPADDFFITTSTGLPDGLEPVRFVAPSS